MKQRNVWTKKSIFKVAVIFICAAVMIISLSACSCNESELLVPEYETEVSSVGSQTGYLDSDGKFYVDYESLDEEQQEARKLAVKIAQEGDVLLKNADNTLPLGKEETRISLFGIRTTDLVHSGVGSGAGAPGNNGIEQSTLAGSLEAAGYSVNQRLLSLYEAQRALGVTAEIPVTEYTSSIVSTYASYNDVAVVTISREGSEDGDLPAYNVAGHSDENDHKCMLDDNEEALIRHVKQYFDKVIVLVNSANILQIPELAEEKTDDNLGVDAILWIGNPGNNGVDAVGGIFSGEVNPSGRTVEVWEKDFSKGPVWTNFSENAQNKDSDGNRLDAYLYDGNGNDTGYRQVEYREGIYMGYRYYETLYADAAEEDKEEAYSNVLYPFGYGLSYTTFDWELDASVPATGLIDKANRTVTIKVKVTNTGDVAGKDVVQIYYNPPYTAGGIEKAAANLVGFGKTKLLRPGESDVVTVRFVAQDMASFDWNDANGNDFLGYELEAGDYIISANRDSHTPVVSMTRTVTNTILCSTDLATGETIEPVFTDEYTTVNATLEANMISRAEGLRQPAASSKSDRTISDDDIAILDAQENYYSYQDEDTDPWYVAEVPEGWTQAAVRNESDVAPISIGDMSGVDFTVPEIGEDNKVTLPSDEGSRKWVQFMNQLTWEEMCDIVNSGSGSVAIPAIGKTETGGTEGSIQIVGGTLWPCAPIMAATFNTELASDMGRMIGNEALFLGQTDWHGPSMDLHRNPLSGRNFEYYSQDGVHSAKMAEAIVAAVSAKGVHCYAKHMLLNDQEKYRNIKGGILTFATEQVIREIYAKPFEAIAKGGHTIGYMSSFNRIGYVNASANYALHHKLVRGEWSFKGSTVTDAWVAAYNPINLLVRAGDEQPLADASTKPLYQLEYGEWSAADNCVKVRASSTDSSNSMLSPTHYYAVRMAAQRVLYAFCNSASIDNNIAESEKNYPEINIAFDVDCTQSFSISIPGVSMTNTQLSSGTLPEGITLTTAGVLSGKATTEGEYPISVSFTTDGWVTSTVDVNISVVNPLHYEGTDLTSVGVGDEVSGSFFTNYYTYGANIARPTDDMQVNIPGMGYPTDANGNSLYGSVETDGMHVESGDGHVHSGYMSGVYYAQKAKVLNWYRVTENDYVGYIDNADKAAGDCVSWQEQISTIGVDNYYKAYTYEYEVTGNVPEGITLTPTMQTHTGTYGDTYQVEDTLVISGSPEEAGTYTFTVTLNVPIVINLYDVFYAYAKFGTSGLIQISQTITMVVEA